MLKITNLTPEKATLVLGDKPNFKVAHFEYKQLKKNANSEVIAEIEGLENIEVSSTCGCSTPKVISSDGKHKVSIVYDSSRVGQFHKVLNGFTVINGRKQKTIEFRIKGEVL